ncbi:MAG: NYN domain-containing protein [Oscillospiraceae bacterium]|nr:NYN domain-containing protein [Oscillospiraceae bacterium]
MEQDFRLAVLIDGDNAPRTAIREIMGECVKYGTPTIKRIYGDWAMNNMDSWKPLLLENALVPVQQYSYTTGKNSTDSAMIIDAMDILYSQPVDGFVLVSSDSDFTRLALRLREAGKKVYGIGEKKTPNPFIVACDKFIYVEVIRGENVEKSAEKGKGKEAPASTRAAKKSIPADVVELIAATVQDVSDEEGWAFMGELGNILPKKQPDFDPRNYGFDKLTTMVKSIDRFEIDARPTSAPKVKHIYVRDKKAGQG